MIDWALLLTALIAVESGGNTEAIGDGGRAVGCLQIHAVYVRDCNEILARKHDGNGLPYRYSLADCKGEATSKGMARTYLQHYGEAYRRRTGHEASYAVLARIHNGGPHGWQKGATVKYWHKVKAEMDRLRSAR